MLALGVGPDIVISSSNPPAYAPVGGVWHNSEGDWHGARGNPAFQFTVTSAGPVVITLESLNVGAVVLDLFDPIGDRISRDVQWQPNAIVGADLAPGIYSVIVQNSFGGNGNFDITFEGNNLGPIELDTDRDGDPDSIDTDDDDDGNPDGSDPDPLDWSIN